MAPIKEEEEFVEPVASDFLSPITYTLLRQPHLTICCGKHISAATVARLQEDGNPCPLCTTKPLKTVLNKHFKRQVEELRVLCRHVDRGCVVQPELSSLDSHVKSCPMRDAPLLEDFQTLSMEPDSDKIAVSGAPILKRQCFVYTGRKLDFTWKEAGISLHFPAVAKLCEIRISVKVMEKVVENSILPPNYRLMGIASAIYQITASDTLPAAVRVRMQHCAVVDNENAMVHMVARCKSPYRFKPYNKGKFPLGEFYGEIEMTRFSVFMSLADMLELTISLVLYVVYFEDRTAHIVVIKYNQAHLNPVREKYRNAVKIDEYCMTSYKFSTKIAFSVADYNAQNGWHIKMNPTPATIDMKIIKDHSNGSPLPVIKQKMEWEKIDADPIEMTVQIRVKGVSKKYIPLFCKSPQPTSSRSQDQNWSQIQPDGPIEANDGGNPPPAPHICHPGGPLGPRGITLDKSPGLAILVTCQYENCKSLPKLPGTKVDANEMRTTFNYLNYIVCELQDPTCKGIEDQLEAVSNYLEEYKGEQRKKVIIFAFSGHGCNGGKDGIIYASDGEPLDVKKKIIYRLTKHVSVADIPKLFFIDACRGVEEIVTREKGVNRVGDTDGHAKSVEAFSDKGVEHAEKNYWIGNATINHHKCYVSAESGSRWMTKMARCLREKNESLLDISGMVNKEVHNDLGTTRQVCEGIDRSLLVCPLYLQKRQE